MKKTPVRYIKFMVAAAFIALFLLSLTFMFLVTDTTYLSSLQEIVADSQQLNRQKVGHALNDNNLVKRNEVIDYLHGYKMLPMQHPS